YRAALRARFGRHQRHMTLLSRAVHATAGRTPQRTLSGDQGIVRSGPVIVGAALEAAARDQRVFDDLTELGLAEGPLTARIVTGLLTQLARPHRGSSAGGSRRASA
ncbi:MAG: hypothetical protein H0X35_14120, partial [Pseudonocardiales bacterium]|nr:hypothetical protein [Pseudonocardiales bacterium]